MRYYFTEEDHHTRSRGSEIRAALVHARHEVVHGQLGVPAPPGTDVWFHGIGIDGRARALPGPDREPLDPAIVQGLLESKAEVVLFQLCDADSMSFYRIPDSLGARTRLFLRNHWPKDTSEIPAAYRNRIGLLPPMLKAMPARPGKTLAERAHGAIFFGTRTGFSNMGEGKNAREETVRHMRGSDLPFVGGISPHADARYETPEELRVGRITEREHTRLLADSKICLAPWGNHPLTYRFFEGLAHRCLVVAQPIDDVRILDGGLLPGRDYVAVSADLSDLVEVVRHYLAHPEEAQRIADAGHELFARCLAARGPLISSWMFEATVASWGDLYTASNRRGVGPSARALAARFFPRKF